MHPSEDLKPNGLPYDGLVLGGIFEPNAGGGVTRGEQVGMPGEVAIHVAEERPIESLAAVKDNSFVCRPGDRIPMWAVECLASYPLIDQRWWEDEIFALVAAGMGVREKPPVKPQRTASEDGRAWEPMARQVLATEKIDLHDSWFQSVEIGVRGYAQVSPVCAQAYQRFVQARVEEEEKKKAANLRRRLG